jgi:Carboxypeptidase regulatory-like domain
MIKRINFGCRSLWIVVFSVLLLTSAAAAQTGSTGALSGTVTDPSGGVVANATVTATSLDTAQVRPATTGSNGSYTITLLPPGNYKVKFEAPGFKTTEIPSATVIVTETEVLNRQLEIGAQSQQITVQSEVETVQTESSTVGSVVAGTVMTDLPLSTRNYTNLLTLSAGANATVQNATAIGKGSDNVAVNGMSTGQNAWQMDGVYISSVGSVNTLTESGSFGSIPIPSPDAIQEFKIQTSNYDASYGRNPGANVNVVTKSGTNSYHGTMFEFLRNTDLNANDFFLKKAGQPRGVLNQNQWGGVFGGPIKKDKLFIFLSYQYTGQKNGYSPTYSLQTGVGLPPIPSGDRGTCPAGSTSLAQCDPTTQAFAANLGAAICATSSNPASIANSAAGSKPGSLVGAQVACNGSNINPVAVQIMQLKLPAGGYYLPSSGTGAYSSTAYSIPAIYRENQGLANFDYVFNSKNTLSGRTFYSVDPTSAPFQNSAGALQIPGTPFNFTFENAADVLKLTSILSPNVVNEARISYQRNGAQENSPQVFTNSQVGITPIQPSVDYLSFITISGVYSIGTNPSSVESFTVNQFQAADQVSWNHGPHSIRFGFEGTHELYKYNYKGLPIGGYTFPSFADFLLGLPGCAPGTAPADCAASQTAGLTNGTSFSSISSVGTTDRTLPQGDIHYLHTYSLNGFIQDDYKVNRRLTLNMGLRWEYYSNETEENGELSGIAQSLIQLQTLPGTGCVYNNFSWGAGSTGTGCSFTGDVAPANYNPSLQGPLPGGAFQNSNNTIILQRPPWDDFAPRFGFAWQPLQTDRFVIRGGAGYFYDRTPPGIYIASVTQTAPSAVPLSQSGAALYASTLANPSPDTPLGWQPRYANLATGQSSNLNPGGNFGTLPENYTVPLVYEYNLNTQYEFAPGWVLEVGYVGTHGIHQILTDPVNGALLMNAANSVNGVTTTTTSNASARVPFIGYSPAFHQYSTNTSFLFNSLQTTVRKQLSHGLTFQLAYTWSRAFSPTYVGNANASFSDNVPVLLEYGLNTNYHPQRVTINYSYNLPSGHHEGFTGKLLAGWNFSGVTTIQDGTPLSITDSRGGSVFGTPVTGLAQYASGMGVQDVATPGSLYQRVQTKYLNPAAFTPSTTSASTLPGCTGCTGTLYGDGGLGILLGPGQSNFDMALAKTTTVGGLREDATLQFRAEFFNAFNHPQFNNPILTFNTSNFGNITSSSVNPRLIQFGLKYSF